MYEVTVEGRFSAAHRHAHPERGEALHGHDFLVLLTVAGEELVDDVLVDFHELEVELNRHLEELTNRELETHPDLAGGPATPAALAHFLYERMSPMVESVSGIRLTGVEVRDTDTTGARYLP